MINLSKKIFLLETCKLIVIKKRLKLIIICLTLLSTIAIFKVSLESYENNDIESEYKIVILGDQQRTSYITVVTTLFLFGRSKHSKNQYGAWSNTMLKSLGAPIVAFIDFNWEQKFIERCRENNVTGIVYITKSIWNILRELERLRKTEYIESYKTKQLKMDAQKRMHSPELYAVWNLKTYLVNKVAQKNPFKSEFFIFTDSGAWRERKFSNWPNEDIVRNVSRKLQNRILYAQIYNPKKKDFSIRSNIIEGGFFAGTSLAISTAFDNFYSLHDEWLAKGMFIGKDQDIMNQLAFIQAKSSIARLRTFGLTCNVSYNRWFFYQYYFSQRTEYPCRDYRLALLMF